MSCDHSAYGKGMPAVEIIPSRRPWQPNSIISGCRFLFPHDFGNEGHVVVIPRGGMDRGWSRIERMIADQAIFGLETREGEGEWTADGRGLGG
jgi:hypothetical protein